MPTRIIETLGERYFAEIAAGKGKILDSALNAFPAEDFNYWETLRAKHGVKIVESREFKTGVIFDCSDNSVYATLSNGLVADIVTAIRNSEFESAYDKAFRTILTIHSFYCVKADLDMIINHEADFAMDCAFQIHRSIGNFDPSKSLTLAAYVNGIAVKVLTSVIGNDAKPVRYPKFVSNEFARFKKEKAKAEKEQGRSFSDEEFAKIFGWDEERYGLYRKYEASAYSMEGSRNADTGEDVPFEMAADDFTGVYFDDRTASALIDAVCEYVAKQDIRTQKILTYCLTRKPRVADLRAFLLDNGFATEKVAYKNMHAFINDISTDEGLRRAANRECDKMIAYLESRGFDFGFSER